MAKNKRLDKDIKNLKRRIKYFISVNGGQFDAEQWSNPTDRKELNKAKRALQKARTTYEFNKRVERVEEKAKKLGVTLPKEKTPKTEKELKAAQNKVSKTARDYGLRFKSDVKTEANKFMAELQEYNQAIGRKDQYKRLNLRPRTADELIRYRKILDAAKKGDFAYVKRMLGGSAKENIHRASINQDAFRAIKAKDYSYQDWVFLQTAIREAEGSHLPELANLLRDGGEGLLKDLAKAQFGILDFAMAYQQDFEQDEFFDGEDYILGMLESVQRKLKPENKKLVSKFITMIRAIK